MGLDPVEERVEKGLTANALIATLQKKMDSIPDAQIFVIPPPPVQGLGTSGGFKFVVQDRAARGNLALQTSTDELVAKTYQSPSLFGVFSTFRATTPQLFADVDRVKANMLNVPLSSIFEALQVNLGSSYVNDFNSFGRTFQVRAQAEGDYRRIEDDIRLLKTRNRDGPDGAARIGAQCTVEERPRPRRPLQHVSGLRSARRRRARLQLRPGDDKRSKSSPPKCCRPA